MKLQCNKVLGKIIAYKLVTDVTVKQYKYLMFMDSISYIMSRDFSSIEANVHTKWLDFSFYLSLCIAQAFVEFG